MDTDQFDTAVELCLLEHGDRRISREEYDRWAKINLVGWTIGMIDRTWARYLLQAPRG